MIITRRLSGRANLVPFYFKLLFALSLLLLLVSCGGGGNNSGLGDNQPPPPTLSLSVSPNSFIVFASNSFSVNVSASTNATETPTVTLVALPQGVSTSTKFPLSVPSGGATINFQTASSVTYGTYIITLGAVVGTASTTASITVILQKGPTTFSFLAPIVDEVAVPIGGSSNMTFGSSQNGAGSFSVALSLNGLPPGTSATFNPPTLTPGQSTTVTIAASPTAPVSQDVTVTLTGVPSAIAPPETTSFLVDVTQAPTLMPNNRTNYVSTEDTPYAAVYDAAHQRIYASNPSWNRVDVISTPTQAGVTRIPIPNPQGIDITQDGSTVWVATGSRQVFAINTSNQAVTRYLLPLGSGSPPISYWEGGQLLALADGTVMIVLTESGAILGAAIWDPKTNQITIPQPPMLVGPEFSVRSGDGTHVYFASGSSSGTVVSYDVAAKTFSQPITLGEYTLALAVNQDGSRVVDCTLDNGPNMYDGSLNLIGSLPGCPGGTLFPGGSVFSPDNAYLYQEYLGIIPVIVKIDPNTLNIMSVAPAMPMIPVGAQLSPPYFLPIPFAVDSTGLLMGIEDWGIAFDDGAYTPNYLGTPVGSRPSSVV